MAADEAAVAQVDPSATAEVPAVSQPGDDAGQPVPVVEELTGKGREQWLKEPADYPKPPKKSKAPKPSQDAKSADSQPATESDDKADSSTAPSPEKAEVAETASDSATDDKTQVEGKQPSEAEKRIKSLLAETKLLKQRLSQYEQPPAPKTDQSPKADPQRPDPTKFETMEQYLEALSDYKVEKALVAERERVAQERQEHRQQSQMRVEREQWNNKIVEARKKHADYDDVALNPDLPVAEGSAIDWWVMNSEHGAEVLYHYGKNPDQLEALNAMPPIEAARELARLEISLLTPPKPAPTPKAPRPPSEANPTGKVDPLAAALQAGDFATYRRLADAEERKGRS